MTRRVILCGGGHSHVLALPYLLEHSPKDVEWLLVSDTPYAPYSGMLPGFIGGQFSRWQCLIDLPKLCKAHGVTWRQNTFVKMEGGAVHFENETLEYDILSVNIGGVQKLPFTPAGANAVAVKPALPLMDFVESLPTTSATGEKKHNIAVIGAGAGGCELTMALKRRFPQATIQLAGVSLLPGFNQPVRDKVLKIFQERGIRFYEGMAKESQTGAFTVNGETCNAEHVIFATPATSAAGEGSIKVNACLQMETESSSKEIFAAGDCAESGAAKSGVVAVRQAPVLAHNIIAALNRTAMKEWHAKKHFLYILNTADGRAIANWGRHTFAGRLVWSWKKYLDLEFMQRVTGIYQ